MRRWWSGVWWSVVLLLLCGCGADSAAGTGASPATLRFSAIPDDNETLLRQRYGVVARALGERLRIPVEYTHATEYADAVELFRNGDVQLAWFGGLSGVQARYAVKGARAIVQGRSDPAFYSYFIAHRDTGLVRDNAFPAGIAGRTFTFGSADSTSGRLMPEWFIRKFTGKRPEDLFGRPNSYSGSHDKTAIAVQSGAFEVGALNYKTYERMVADQKIDPEVCRVIWQSPVYADYNFTAHPRLEEMFGPGFIDRLQQVLLELEPELVAAFDREAFVPAKNSDYARIEKLAHELDFLR